MSKKLSLLHTCVYNALFRKESKLSYERTLEAIYNLAEEAKRLKIDLDENACDCEGDVTIQDILTGAYNFVLKYYQDSDWIEDRVLAILDDFALPDKIEDNTSEKDVYDLLLKKRTFTVVEYKDSFRNCWKLEYFLESCERVIVRDIENGDDEYNNYTYRYTLSREGNVAIHGHVDFQSDYDSTGKIIKHIANDFQSVMIGMAVETVRKK